MFLGSSADQLRDQRAIRGELSPHPAPHGPSGQLGWAGGGPGGPTWSQGHLVRWRASPTGASASSFASSPYKWLAPGRQGVASVQPIGRGRSCTASHPSQNLIRPRSSKFCISPLFLTIFLGESLRKGSQHCFILRDILFRGNYVTNRCPGSARNSGSAAAGPGNGSRLVKCQRRPRHWISTEPTARRSTYRFAEPERVKQYIKIGTSFALAGFR